MVINDNLLPDQTHRNLDSFPPTRFSQNTTTFRTNLHIYAEDDAYDGGHCRSGELDDGGHCQNGELDDGGHCRSKELDDTGRCWGNELDDADRYMIG